MNRRRSPLPIATLRTACLSIACLSIAVAVLQAGGTIARAQAPLALPADRLPDDRRLAAAHHVDGYHPFHPVSSAEEWQARSAEIRRRVAVAAGLWPMPQKRPLEPVVHGRIDKGDYTIEKVFFESFPGHFVSGNLYRPAGPSLTHGAKGGRRPGVLCPHGHWKNGRFVDLGEKAAAREIAEGAERFANGGRSPLQACCVGLARLGCVAFHYDMLGYADSLQFPEHRHGHRDSLDGREPGSWGFVGFEATARLQNSFGLQTFNSICALDFLLSLPEVDTGRIAVTGGSGGGTQTMMLTALDDRVSAAFPCVMVSTAMQGGCPCENAPLLRIGQGNIDIAALTAPRPLGLTAANDWTKHLEQKGWPDLVALYRLLGVDDRAEAHFDIRFEHNYNGVTRSHIFRFLDRHFALGHGSPGDERDFELLAPQALSVWDDAHPAPSGAAAGEEHERHLCRQWAEDTARTVGPLLEPRDAASLEQARTILGGGFDVVLGRRPPRPDEVVFEPAAEDEDNVGDRPPGLRVGLVFNRTHGERIPAVVLRPADWNGSVVVWLHPDGKDGLFEPPAGAGGSDESEADESEADEREADESEVDEKPGRPIAAVQAILDRGAAVVAADLFGQGEFRGDGETFAENRQLAYHDRWLTDADSWRHDPAFTFGYNDSIFAKRVHDVLTLLAFAAADGADSDHSGRANRVTLVGLAGAGHWAAGGLAASRLWAATDDAPAHVHAAVIEPAGFRFEKLPSLWHADFLPGAVRYGDLPGLLVLAASLPLHLAGADPAAAAGLAAAYRAAGCPASLHTDDGGGAAEWIDLAAPPKKTR